MSRRRDNQAMLLAGVWRGALRNAFRRPDDLRYHAMRDAWALTKRFGSERIETIELGELDGVSDQVIEGYIDDPNRAVLACLCRAIAAKTFFEIGTNRGRTAWTVARNNPNCAVYTIDLPSQASVHSAALDLNASDKDFFVEAWDRGEAYRESAEESRITTLEGDSATFDFTPYARMMDVVFIDGAHSYSYVKNDTERAFEMVTPHGIVAWDDYPRIPGIYRYLNELAPGLQGTLYHVYGTRLVIYPQTDIVKRFDIEGRRRLYAA